MTAAALDDKATTEPYSDYADRYLAEGWQPFPVVGKSGGVPPGVTGHQARAIGRADVWDWIIAYPARNIALHLDGVIGIDVDHYVKNGLAKTGADTLALAETAWGPLPKTWRSTARSHGTSGIRFYRVPPGDIGLKTEIKLPHPETGELHGDIEIIQFHHRFAVAPPSLHPDTGGEYRWYCGDDPGEVDMPAVGDLPWLPEGWLAGLAGPAPAEPREYTPAARQDAPQASWHPKVAAAYAEGLEAISGAAGGRHDGMHRTVCKLARLESHGLAGASTAIEQLEPHFVAAIDAPGRSAGREYGRSVRDGRRLVATTAPTPTEPMAPLLDNEEAADDGERATEKHDTLLPSEFWNERPALTHIRGAAESQHAAPDAVLIGVLTRLAALAPPAFRLEMLLGSESPVTVFGAVTGPSGAGKSTSAAIAEKLLPTGTANVAKIGLASGEGLIESYMGTVEEDGDTVRRQVHTGAFAYADEGTTVMELGQRRNSTLLSVLRQMWTGTDCSTDNATEERKRRLPAGRYSLGLLAGIQEEEAGPLLAQDSNGLPQRFLWANAANARRPEAFPDWPGQLDWRAPALGPAHNADRITIDPATKAEISAAKDAITYDGIVIDRLDSHRNLNRLRVAALLAMLDMGRPDRLHVTRDDWRLAGTVMDASDAIRARVTATVTAKAAEADQATTGRAVRRRVAEADALDERAERIHDQALTSAARSAWKKASKLGGEATRGDLGRAMGGRHKTIIGGAGVAIDHAIEMGWLIEAGDGSFRLGPSVPAE